MSARLRELGYTFEQTEGIVRITLPLLLPKRGGNASFITAPLHELLSVHARSFNKYRDCAVIFRHIYAWKKKVADVRDHDNVESRAVLNVIERFLLHSDSGYYCANIQTTEFGISDKTVITIYPGRLDMPLLAKAVTQ